MSYQSLRLWKVTYDAPMTKGGKRNVKFHSRKLDAHRFARRVDINGGVVVGEPEDILIPLRKDELVAWLNKEELF